MLLQKLIVHETLLALEWQNPQRTWTKKLFASNALNQIYGIVLHLIGVRCLKLVNWKELGLKNKTVLFALRLAHPVVINEELDL